MSEPDALSIGAACVIRLPASPVVLDHDVGHRVNFTAVSIPQRWPRQTALRGRRTPFPKIPGEMTPPATRSPQRALRRCWRAWPASSS